MGKRIVSDLLPVLLQGRHRREITGIVDELEFLEDTVIRQHIHAWSAAKEKKNKTGKVSTEVRNPKDFFSFSFFFLLKKSALLLLFPLSLVQEK